MEQQKIEETSSFSEVSVFKQIANDYATLGT